MLTLTATKEHTVDLSRLYIHTFLSRTLTQIQNHFLQQQKHKVNGLLLWLQPMT